VRGSSLASSDRQPLVVSTDFRNMCFAGDPKPAPFGGTALGTVYRRGCYRGRLGIVMALSGLEVLTEQSVRQSRMLRHPRRVQCFEEHSVFFCLIRAQANASSLRVWLLQWAARNGIAVWCAMHFCTILDLKLRSWTPGLDG
jgi:hypothetical protein